MNIDGNTRMAAVIANPIKHSLSPYIHNRAFELTGVNGAYLAWEVAEDDLLQILQNIRKLNMFGVNLSMPYKGLAMWYPEELSDRAKLIGSINTIVNHSGKLTGYNTDGIGFFRSMEAHGFFVKDETITILGGGAAAMAIIVEAAMQNVKQIYVFARKSKSYEPLKKKLQTVSDLTKTSIDLYDLAATYTLHEALEQSSLLVNGTSVGMDGISNPVSEHLLGHKELLVADVIYKTLETPFLKWADKQEMKTINGLGMLIHQAATAFKLWTGKEMPVATIEEELKRKLYL